MQRTNLSIVKQYVADRIEEEKKLVNLEIERAERELKSIAQTRGKESEVYKEKLAEYKRHLSTREALTGISATRVNAIQAEGAKVYLDALKSEESVLKARHDKEIALLELGAAQGKSTAEDVAFFKAQLETEEIAKRRKRIEAFLSWMEGEELTGIDAYKAAQKQKEEAETAAIQARKNLISASIKIETGFYKDKLFMQARHIAEIQALEEQGVISHKKARTEILKAEIQSLKFQKLEHQNTVDVLAKYYRKDSDEYRSAVLAKIGVQKQLAAKQKELRDLAATNRVEDVNRQLAAITRLEEQGVIAAETAATDRARIVEEELQKRLQEVEKTLLKMRMNEEQYTQKYRDYTDQRIAIETDLAKAKKTTDAARLAEQQKGLSDRFAAENRHYAEIGLLEAQGSSFPRGSGRAETPIRVEPDRSEPEGCGKRAR